MPRASYVFLLTSDDLTKADLKRCLQSYCRPGVDTIAYCVGDMSWPTLYPSKVGVHYKVVSAGDDIRRIRIHKNGDNLESEPGGYFGSVISLVRELGKKVLASFRMNDAHFTSLDNPNVSEFWKRQAKRTLGPVYGYYGGCLNCPPGSGGRKAGKDTAGARRATLSRRLIHVPKPRVCRRRDYCPGEWGRSRVRRR
jgi:hypothetical protein